MGSILKKNSFLLSFILLISFSSQAQEKKTGYVIFKFNTDSVLVVIDYDFSKDTVLASGDSLELEEGTHTFEFNIPLSPKITREVYVLEIIPKTIEVNFPDERIAISSVQDNYASREYFGLNAFILTDSDSEIYYRGELLGKGFAAIDLPEGGSWIEIENPNYKSKGLRVNGLPFMKVYEHYTRPSRNTNRLLSFAPGVSQFYKKNYIRSAVAAGVFYPLLFKSISTQVQYNSEIDDINQLIFLYEKSDSERDANSLGNQIETKLRAADDIKRERNLFLLITGLAYGIHFFDAWTTEPKGGFREKRDLDFYINAGELPQGVHTEITMKINF